MSPQQKTAKPEVKIETKRGFLEEIKKHRFIATAAYIPGWYFTTKKSIAYDLFQSYLRAQVQIFCKYNIQIEYTHTTSLKSTRTHLLQVNQENLILFLQPDIYSNFSPN